MKTAQDITVVVPVYNTPVAYLDECLRSLHQQTVPPRKILIMDDGSTLDEIQAYYLAHKDLQVVRTERNRGLGPTMNRALQLCQTDFLLKLDLDDLARPELVEKFAAFLAANRNVDVVGCQCQNFGITDFATSHPQCLTRHYVLSCHWFINHTGIILKKELVLAAGGYRRHMRGMSEDYELWLRMMMRGYRRFYNLPDILVNYRDLPTGLHRHPRKVVNHAMKIWLRTLMRFCPDF